MPLENQHGGLFEFAVSILAQGFLEFLCLVLSCLDFWGF